MSGGQKWYLTGRPRLSDLLLVHKFWDFVADYSFFEGRLALRQGRNTNSLLGSASWDSLILAVKLQFSRSAGSSMPN